MADKKKFENSLKVLRFSLLLSGIKTNESHSNSLLDTFVDYFLYHTNLVILYTVIFGEIAWLIQGIQIGRSFVELSLALPLITITFISTIKSFNLYINRDIVREVLNTLKEIHPVEKTNERDQETSDRENASDQYDQETNDKETNDKETNDKETIDKNEENITNESIRMLNVVVNLLIAVSAPVLIMFCLAPLVLMGYEYTVKGETGISYPFAVEYWYDVYDTRLWPVLYLHQVVATIIVSLNLFGSETLFYAICTYIEMHFHILCHRFSSLQLVSSKQLKDDLVQGVKKQQQLIYLVDQSEILFSIPALCYIVSSSLLICLSAFNITATEDVKTLFAFVTFLLLSLSQVSLLCFFGDKLIQSSAEVSEAIYKCPWYDFDVQTKKAVLIIIMRARKPCKLTAAKFAELNLRAFTTILSRSWSYFALLKTVYK